MGHNTAINHKDKVITAIKYRQSLVYRQRTRQHRSVAVRLRYKPFTSLGQRSIAMQITYKGGRAVFYTEPIDWRHDIDRAEQLKALEKFIKRLRQYKIAYQITTI